MSWFKKDKRNAGWIALQLHQDQVELVHVRIANGRPAVDLCDSFHKGNSDPSPLMRVRRELKLERYHCTTLLPSKQYQIHEIETPNVPPSEIKAAVRWRVQDFIDYSVESATVDALEIPADPERATRSPTLYAVTARSDAVETHVKPFEASGIELHAVDILELAQRNIAVLYEPEDHGGVAMLAFYRDEGLLTFTRGGELYASRRIEIPLAQLLDDNFKQRAEHLERIALEVQRSLDHFERQYRYVPLSKLLLGPLPKEIGLRDYIASSIDGPVENADLSTVMDFKVAALSGADRQSQYLPLIGAALREEAAVA